MTLSGLIVFLNGVYSHTDALGIEFTELTIPVEIPSKLKTSQKSNHADGTILVVFSGKQESALAIDAFLSMYTYLCYEYIDPLTETGGDIIMDGYNNTHGHILDQKCLQVLAE